MKTYATFQPTGFDPQGAFLSDRQDWYVIPISRTRDSGSLDESNFHTALAILGGEQEDLVEVHRFGHWGPGWFELILIHPSLLAKGEELESSLEDYPILDDEDLSHREDEECALVWERCYNERERIKYLRSHVYPRPRPGETRPGETVYATLRAAVRGSWPHAANLLPSPSDILGH